MQQTPSNSSTKPAQARRRGLSIQQKLLALIVLLIAGVVVPLAVYLPSRQIAAQRASLEAKAVTYARLASKQLEPAVAFDDRETAREVLESMAQDSDVESLSLLNARGAVLAARGTPRSVAGVPVTAVPVLLRGEDHVAAIAEVVSLEGPRGVVTVQLSLERLTAEGRTVRRNALIAGLLSLLIGVGGATFIARSLARRLRGITRVADAVAAGNLDHEPLRDDAAGDEISAVSLAFNTMLDEIRSLIAAMQHAAREEQERLEKLVLERTAKLDERNADLKRILDNVGEGFLTLDLGGRMSTERSFVLERWFGPVPDSTLFRDLLTQVDPAVGEWFDLGWEALVDDVLPLELSLDQLPKRLAAGGSQFTLDYRPILAEDGQLERVLVVVADVTARQLRDQAEAHEREMTRLFVRASADRAGLLEFLAESSAQLDCIIGSANATDQATLKHALHTLKGNSATYGVETVATVCHALEDRLEEAGRLEPNDIAALRDRWSALYSKMRELVPERGTKIEIEEAQLQAIVTALEEGRPRSEAIQTLRRLRLEPSEVRLSRLAEQAIALSQRVGKEIQVRTEPGDVRLKADEWGAFWSACVHVLRNSIDHGFESADERRLLGKPALGKLDLRTTLDQERFTVEFSDDGRGIDWSAVEQQASRLGLAVSTPKDLVAALFADGFSTRQHVSDLSGRGAGLGAVRQACRTLGGEVEIDSTPGVGTTFRFVWPADVVNCHLGLTPTSNTRASLAIKEPVAKAHAS
jgi:two-component system, chemotaxis family, sensor kinase CheA